MYIYISIYIYISLSLVAIENCYNPSEWVGGGTCEHPSAQDTSLRQDSLVELLATLLTLWEKPFVVWSRGVNLLFCGDGWQPKDKARGDSWGSEHLIMYAMEGMSATLRG